MEKGQRLSSNYFKMFLQIKKAAIKNKIFFYFLEISLKIDVSRQQFFLNSDVTVFIFIYLMVSTIVRNKCIERTTRAHQFATGDEKELVKVITGLCSILLMSVT